MTDDTGTVLERYAYSPYGRVTYLDDAFEALSTQESTIDNEYLYTGRRLDPGAPGLQLNRNRFYSNQLGKWISRDPIGYGGGYYLYGYLDGRTPNFVDPLGLAWGPIVWLYTGQWEVEDNVYDAAIDAAGEVVAENWGPAQGAIAAVPHPLGPGVAAGMAVLAPELGGPVQPPPPPFVPPQFQPAPQNNQPPPANNPTGDVIRCIGAAAPLIALIPEKPRDPRHHLMAQEFRDEAEELGIDIDEFTIEMTFDEHNAIYNPPDGWGGPRTGGVLGQ